MKRVLFVDDEPNVLQGLRRSLRRMRGEWDMAFADGGEQALETLAREPYDVIVTDMRMPGMDGVQLLSQVQERYPDTVRMVLSGHSDKDMSIAAARIAQQYLAKPCDPDMLRNTVARSCTLRDRLSREPVVRLVSQMDSLPSLPALYVELMDELRSPDACVKRVGDIIGRDMGMTAKVLQLVNSAFFGLAHHVSSPRQAAAMLGLDLIARLALVSGIFSAFDEAGSGLDIEALWAHSMRVAGAARCIAEAEGQDETVIDQTFTAGILHDVGKLVLASRLPEDFARVRQLAREEGIAKWEAEQRVFQCAHAEVGAYLLGAWGIEHPIVEAVAFHHQPHLSDAEGFTPLVAVHVAGAEIRAADSGDASRVDMPYLERLGFADRMPVWQECLAEGVCE